MTKIDYTGQIIDDRYRIIRLLGEGGMGAVYLGEHVIIHRKVAVKFLISDFTMKKEMVQRFYREAQATGAIDSKHIIDVLDVGISPHDEPYMVMEYLTGESLLSLLKRANTLELSAVCAIVEQISLALQAAHAKGIVHRDLKPENIFLIKQENEEPNIKVIDFGISKFTSDETPFNLTRTGTMLGTIAYMSPEQARGAADVDHRTDLYSLGVIMYQALTGQLPFDGESQNDILLKMFSEEATPLREINPTVAPEAEELVLRLLKKKMDQRFQNAEEVLEAIRKLRSYENRNMGLSLYVTPSEQRRVAGGDLGEELERDSSGNMVADVFSQMANRGTPGTWVNSAANFKTPWQKPVFFTLGIIAVLAIILYFAVGPSDKPTGAEKTSVVNSHKLDTKTSNATTGTYPILDAHYRKEHSVSIKVTGIPKNTKIYYDDALVPENPFRVLKKEVLVKLRVEAPGFEDFIYAVKPYQDQIVRVDLKKLIEKRDPIAQKEEEASTAKNDSTQKTTSKKSKSRAKETDRNREKTINKLYIEDDEGSFFVKDFE